MTKEQLLFLRELHQKDDGTGHHMAGIVSVVFDGGVSYEMNNISPEGARHMVIWDDANEIVSACCHNTDFYTQAQQPFKIMSGVYANIHYMEGIYSMKNFIATIEKNFPMLTADQIAIIKEWANQVRNSVQQPRALPYYDDNKFNIVPHPNQAINREDTKPSTVVKSSTAEKLAENLAAMDEGASVMVQGAIQAPLALTKSVKLIGNINQPATAAITASEDVKRVDLDNFTFVGTDAGFADAETPAAAKTNVLVASNAPVTTISNSTFKGTEETKNFRIGTSFSGEDVVVSGCTFDMDGKVYNSIEQTQKSAPLKSLIVKDCKFLKGNGTHNTISVYNFADGARVTIENCEWDNDMNIRFSNYLGAKNVSIVFKNCWVKGRVLVDNVAHVLFQAVNSKQDDFSGFNVQFINCIGSDRKPIMGPVSDGMPVTAMWGPFTGEPVIVYR